MNLTKKSTVLLFALAQFVASGQALLWEKSYGGKHADYLMDAKATPDYGFILGGSSLSNKSGNKTSNNKGDLDYWVWKMDEKGDLDWQKSFGGAGADFLQSIVLTKDAGFILAGTSNSNKDFDKTEDSRGQEDFWIIKLNAKGGEEWQKTIGGAGQEKLQSIYQTKDGGYILGGSSSSDQSETAIGTSEQNSKGEKSTNSFGSMDYWIVKLDAQGKIQWQQTYGGEYNDELHSIEQTTDCGYLAGGYSNSPTSGSKTDDNIGVGDYWILKLDQNGKIQWQKTIGGNKDDVLSAVHQTKDGNYLLAGNSNSGSSGSKTKDNANGTDFWLLKLDTIGDTLWQYTYNFGAVDVLTSVVENDDQTLLLGGYAQSELTKNSGSAFRKPKEQEGINDYIALKITKDGEELWRKTVGSAGEDILRKVIETRDGGYLLAGTSNPQAVLMQNSTSENGLGELFDGEIQGVSNLKNKVNDALQQATNDANKAILEETQKATAKAREALGLSKDSPLKIGDNFLTGGLAAPNLGGGAGAGGAVNEKKLPPSRDKANNLGSNDFWVVKLKDNNKPDKEKQGLEVFPNPTTAFANIIVGYDFAGGTATIVDLAGRVLEQFTVSNRTVPIDLSPYPDGIYVINVSTNVQSDGVKVMKSNKKN